MNKLVCLAPLQGKMTSKITSIILMRIFLLFISIGLGTVYANPSYAQTKINIDANGITYEELFDQIQGKSEFIFFYKDNVLNPEKKVFLNLRKAELSTILDRVFGNTDLDYSIDERQVVIKKRDVLIETGLSLPILLQDFTVSGTITDTDGQPLPGANILEKGTTNGTQTDFDGKFSLEVADENAILVISYIGFATQEIAVNGQTSLSIALAEDAAGLEEVVVVGYGTQRKKEVTGAIAQVSGDQITKTPAVALSNTLAGRLPGVFVSQTSSQPGQDGANVSIRGLGTIDTNTEDDINPNSVLIVIDGVPSRDRGGLSRIDPNDVENISVLKDASAAIYGARAANGVILITTKRGKSGKTVFNYGFNHGIVSPISPVKVANAAQYATHVNAIDEWNGNTLTFSDEQITAWQNGTAPSYDWIEESLKSYSDLARHTLSVNGGGEKVRYFLSGGYLDQNGLHKNDNTTQNEQLNVRSNIDVQVSDRLKFSVDLAARRQKFHAYDPPQMQDALLTPPISQIYIDDDPRYPTQGRARQNPLGVVLGNAYNRRTINVLNTTFRANYDIPGVEGLSVGGWVAFDLDQQFNRKFDAPWSWYEKDSGTGEVIEVVHPEIATALRNEYAKRQSITQNYRLAYKRAFGKHEVDAFVAYEKNNFEFENFWGLRDNFISNTIDQFSAGSNAREASAVDGSANETARINYLGRLNYAFSKKYLASFIFRYDGSERFAEGKRFGFFPGVSLGWVISEEDFLKESNTLNNLKLRASWGSLGNDRIGAFQYLRLFQFGDNYVQDGEDRSGIKLAGEPNPNITWETSENLNLGLDARLFENKLNLELDVFHIKTKDILAPPNAVIPSTTGLSLPPQNIASHENKGIDLALSYRSSIGEFNYKIGGNVSYARNKVTFFDEPEQPEEYQNRTGRPWGVPLVYKFVGVFRTQAEIDAAPHRDGDRPGDAIFADLNNDGVINGDDRYRMDLTSNPEVQYGITADLSYKGFDLSALFQGSARSKRQYQPFFSSGNNGLAWLADNTYSSRNLDAKLPRPGSAPNETDLWYLDSSYLRLKSLELGYNIPENLISVLGLSRLRVYVSGYNLLTWDSLSDIGFTDPEQNNGSAREYVQTKTVSMGLNVTF